MKTRLKVCVTTGIVTLSLLAPGVAMAGALPAPAVDRASCMGSGSSFYGTFAPQQRAFVAAFVVEQAATAGTSPGGTYAMFAQEKEGGSIPAPCGTRIE